MNVLLVDVDSLRPDHLGAYGYGRPTSPTIDALADDGVRFTDCFASDTPCLPSRTGLITGRFGARTGVVTHFGEGQWYEPTERGHEVDADRPLLAQHLARHGVHTATVSSFGSHHAARHFSGAFTDAIQPTPRKEDERRSDPTARATSWLEDHADGDDWLLHVQYWTVHHPYEDVDDDVERVRSDDWSLDWPDEDALDDQRGTTGPRTADFWPTPEAYGQPEYEEQYGDWPLPDRFETVEDAEHLVNGYDGAIRAVDREVRALLDALEAEGVREETAVVVTADHGEALGEHGLYSEHAMAHPPTQRVPLIVAGPPVDAAGRSVDEYCYQFDLAATLCEYFRVPVPSGWDARSLAPALDGDAVDGRDALVCGHGIFTFSRAVYAEDWAYVRILHPGVFSHPELFNAEDADGPASGLELLHDLERDPYMERNLIAERPGVAEDMRARLAAWREEMLLTEDAAGRDPLAHMAVEAGPFYYVNPEELAALYRRLGRDEDQIRTVERAHDHPTPGRWTDGR